MNVSRQVTPSRSYGSRFNSCTLKQRLIINENRRKLKKCLFWGATNMCLLLIVLYDIMHTCPVNMIWFILYLEYVLSAIFFTNATYHFIRYINITLNTAPIIVTPEQKRLLGIKDYDPTYRLADSPCSLPSAGNTPNTSFSNTPMNLSALSWRSNATSFNDSQNFSPPSVLFSCVKSSPQHSYDRQSPSNVSPLNMNRLDTSGSEFINDEQSLTNYLKGYQIYENTANLNSPTEQPTSLLSSFWNHPAAKNNGEAPSFLRRSQYQLSPLSKNVKLQTQLNPPPVFIPELLSPSAFSRDCYGCCPRNYFRGYDSSSSSPSGKSDDKGSPVNSQPQGMEMWRRLQVDSVTLTQWNANIRRWISQTIVERLVKEIEYIDETLQKHGLSDVRVGGVGLDRLRKTAQMTPVLQFIPTLSTLIPFLEISSNQEYLVKRIRELANGGCMSNFKWNGGSSFGGKEWNDSLPTDSAIIMHLFVTYMDTQLLPMPNNPDVKPFSGNHYIKSMDKMPTLSYNTFAIHQVSEKPPHYQVIIGEEIFQMVKGYNNLLHSILLFIYQVNKKEHGMLGRINLGSLGINILWVIDS